MLELKSPNSTFPVQVTDDQSSIYVSISNVGGLVGNFLIVPISHYLGVKNTLHLLSIPMLLGTLLIVFANDIYYLYASRVLFGFVSGASAVCIPSVVNDVSFDR